MAIYVEEYQHDKKNYTTVHNLIKNIISPKFHPQKYNFIKSLSFYNSTH